MALPSLTSSDYIGYLKISVDTFTQTEFNLFASDRLEYWLVKILGDQAVESIRAAPTQPQLYNDLLNGVVYDGLDGYTHKFAGLVEVCKYLIYPELRVASNYVSTNTGDKINQNLSSDSAAGAGASLGVLRYNKGINLYCKLQKFVDTFKQSQLVIISVATGPTTKLINVESAGYLVEKAYFDLNGTRYRVISVTVNDPTSTDIEVSIDFNGQAGNVITYQPFENMPLPNLYYSCL